MSVRYLYADSEPFPHNFDFLSTLRGFLTASTEIVDAMGELETLEHAIQGEQSKSESSERAVDVFADAVADQVDLAIGRNLEPSTVEALGRSIQDYLRSAATKAKGERRSALSALEAQMSQTTGSHRQRIHGSLEQFFLNHELDVQGTRLELRLSGEQYQATVECLFPEGVVVRYGLATSKVERWRKPERIGDLAGGVAIQVGMKKRFLSRDMTREVTRLDELYLGTLVLYEDGIEVGLRRRPDQPDSMMLRLRRNASDGVVQGTVVRPDREDHAFPIAEEDRVDLNRLWSDLTDSVKPLLLHRERVLEATLEGGDLFSVDVAAHFVELYVALFAPTVWEVAQRSPSKKELSLKIEHPDGRREELYLKRQELTEVFGQFNERQSKVFGPLELMPSASGEIPAQAATEAEVAS